MNINLNKVLTNYDIINICKRLKLKINGIYMRDEITTRNLDDGCTVMNLQSKGQSGSHWTAIYKQGNVIMYCDPYGMPYPNDEKLVFEKQRNTVFYNNVQYQDYYSHNCGLFAILFLYVMSRDKSPILTRVSNMIKLFETNKNHLSKNNNLVISYVTELLQ
jgi:hypothetical protein